MFDWRKRTNRWVKLTVRYVHRVHTGISVTTDSQKNRIIDRNNWQIDKNTDIWFPFTLNNQYNKSLSLPLPIVLLKSVIWLNISFVNSKGNLMFSLTAKIVLITFDQIQKIWEPCFYSSMRKREIKKEDKKQTEMRMNWFKKIESQHHCG